MTGLCVTKTDAASRAEDRLPQLCVVHPLNTWLWIIVCLTPSVLYQVYRCLSACELSNHLRQMLYSNENGTNSNRSRIERLPEGNFLMPDRESVPPFNTPAINKYLVKVEDDDSTIPRWKIKEPSPVFTCKEEEQLDLRALILSQVIIDFSHSFY